MYRFVKFIGILIVIGITFFLICDENQIEVKFDNNTISFDYPGKVEVEQGKQENFDQLKEQEEQKRLEDEKKNIIYRIPDFLPANYGVLGYKMMRDSVGIDPNFVKDSPSTKIIALNDESLSNVFAENSQSYTNRDSYKNTGMVIDLKDLIENRGTIVDKNYTGEIKSGSRELLTGNIEIQLTGEYEEQNQTMLSGLNSTGISTGGNNKDFVVTTGGNNKDYAVTTGIDINTGIVVNSGVDNAKDTKTGSDNIEVITGDELKDEIKTVSVKKVEITPHKLNIKFGLQSDIVTESAELHRGQDNFLVVTGEEFNSGVVVNSGVDNNKDIKTGSDNIEVITGNELKDEIKTVSVKKVEIISHDLNMRFGLQSDIVTESAELYRGQANLFELQNAQLPKIITKSVQLYNNEPNNIGLNKGQTPKTITRSVNHMFTGTTLNVSLSKGIVPVVTTRAVNPYIYSLHSKTLYKAISEENSEFMQSFDGLMTSDVLSSQDTFYSNGDDNMSTVELEKLLEGDDIDINTLESDNDEFLQRLYEKTQDSDVMNLIVETYLNEYQFTKAKKFIESLSGTAILQLNPISHLRVSFNSFSLSSQTTVQSLEYLIENYKSKKQISNEDAMRYKGILALMQKKYDKFNEIAQSFGSAKNKSFAAKIQDLREQTEKQKGMPSYYLDVLVAVELFNEGFFQPAKVLALSALAQNSNYILPYQVLAYANFLTNSRDTSLEYLKKLVDLDPNNAEKYRFLMGVAYYRNEKYEQSVLMLSMVKNEDLRLDAERYLISNYLILDQKNKLISSRSKILGYNDLTISDFYTYFYEAFYRPYSEGKTSEIYAYNTNLATKMLRVCETKFTGDNLVVCEYGKIGKDLTEGIYTGLESSLLGLIEKYPQGYLYQALGEYYLQQDDEEKAKVYLLKAVGMTQTTTEILQIKKLLKTIM